MRVNVKNVVNIKSVKYKAKCKQCVDPVNQCVDPNVDPKIGTLWCFDNIWAGLAPCSPRRRAPNYIKCARRVRTPTSARGDSTPRQKKDEMKTCSCHPARKLPKYNKGLFQVQTCFLYLGAPLNIIVRTCCPEFPKLSMQNMQHQHEFWGVEWQQVLVIIFGGAHKYNKCFFRSATGLISMERQLHVRNLATILPQTSARGDSIQFNFSVRQFNVHIRCASLI